MTNLLRLRPTTFNVTDTMVHIKINVEDAETRAGYLRPLTAVKLDGAVFPEHQDTIVWVMAGYNSDVYRFGPELMPETPDELLNLMVACLADATPSYAAELPDTEELRRRIADAEGESGACSDRDCSCHRVPNELREELEYMEAL